MILTSRIFEIQYFIKKKLKMLRWTVHSSLFFRGEKLGLLMRVTLGRVENARG